MKQKPSPALADLFAVQMAVMTRLIVHLEERGLYDAQTVLAELSSLVTKLPAGQGQHLADFCASLHGQIESSRRQRGQTTEPRH